MQTPTDKYLNYLRLQAMQCSAVKVRLGVVGHKPNSVKYFTVRGQ